MQPPLVNLLDNATTVHFQHRFFAFVVLGLALALWVAARRTALQPAASLILCLVAVQIGLGIGTVVAHVPSALASLHQVVAVALFAAALFLCHRTYRS